MMTYYLGKLAEWVEKYSYHSLVFLIIALAALGFLAMLIYEPSVPNPLPYWEVPR